jgi:hypothetical protein
MYYESFLQQLKKERKTNKTFTKEVDRRFSLLSTSILQKDKMIASHRLLIIFTISTMLFYSSFGSSNENLKTQVQNLVKSMKENFESSDKIIKKSTFVSSRHHKGRHRSEIEITKEDIRDLSGLLHRRIKTLIRKIEEDDYKDISYFTSHVDKHLETFFKMINAQYIPHRATTDFKHGLKNLDQVMDLLNQAGKTNIKVDYLKSTTLTSKQLNFKSANHACYTVSTPANIILRKSLLVGGSTKDDFGEKTMKAIRSLEMLKGSDDDLDYRHAEIITNLESYNNIETTSYYPWAFNYKKDKSERKPQFLKIDNNYGEYFNYRSKYSVFRVKARTFEMETWKKEMALKRAGVKKSYLRLGTCADFINWTYLHDLTSKWNQVPVLKHLMQIVYLPEGIQTPDNLADSHMTEKICEVEDSQIVYPQYKVVRDWRDRLVEDQKSSNEKIKNHAQTVLTFLRSNQILDDQNMPLVDLAFISTKSTLSQLPRALENQQNNGPFMIEMDTLEDREDEEW